MDREAKKWHKEKDKEVKKMIKKAKKEGMHLSFINLLKAQDKLKKKYKFHMEFHDGATEEEIVKFEKTLGVTIPAHYREFLKFTNGADLGEAGVEFFGVSKTAGSTSMYDMNYIDPEIDAYDIAGARSSNLLIFAIDLGNYLHGINMETGEVAYWDYTDPDGEEYSEISADFYTYIEEHLIGFIKDKERD